jgi:hypothetical protein
MGEYAFLGEDFTDLGSISKYSNDYQVGRSIEIQPLPILNLNYLAHTDGNSIANPSRNISYSPISTT